jgi:transcriptional regulator with XRE-family HTH domain
MITDQNRTRLATALRRWRLRRRVSQQELALQARTTQRYVSFIESGRRERQRVLTLMLTSAATLMGCSGEGEASGWSAPGSRPADHVLIMSAPSSSPRRGCHPR